MKAFYRARLNRHQAKLMRYLKYVLNDHVVLVGSFLLGGLALYYADFVKTLDASFVLGPVFLALLWLSALAVGKMATLLQEADKVFLLPKENELPAYLQASLSHSLFLPGGFLFLTAGISMPLLVAVKGSTLQDFVCFFALLLALKIADLLQQAAGFFHTQTGSHRQQFGRALWLAVSLVAIASSLWWHSWSGLLLALFYLIYQVSVLKQLLSSASFDWEKMIQLESQRLKRIYQFINLFTDVPGISSPVKRRKIFDPWLAKIPYGPQHTFEHLYWRSLLRGSGYFQLVLRLTVLDAIALCFAKQFIIVLVLALVGIYLIGFQLLPLYSHYDYMTMTELYPLPLAAKEQAFSRLLAIVLGSVSLVFVISGSLSLTNWAERGLLLLSLVLEVFVFCRFYARQRLKKMTQRF